MEQQDSGGPKITAGYEQYQEFLRSAVWTDLRTELDLQRGMVIDALSTANDIVDIYRLQGKLEACNDFLDMPGDIIKIMEDELARQEVVTESVSDIVDTEAFYSGLLDKYKESQ